MTSLITSLPSLVLFIIIFIIGLLAAQGGAWAASRREQKGIKEPSVGPLIGSLLGLLAFMLGFTFSFTASRYSERKHLVVEQANAIATSYLRTSVLPDLQKRQTQKLYTEYVNLLLESTNRHAIDKNMAQLESLQSQIWDLAASLKDEKMDFSLRTLYLTSVNQVIDIFAERKTVVLVFKIPGAIWIALVLLFILGMFVVGSEINAVKMRKSLNVPIMTAAFALIVTLIAAMDASHKAGQFTVSQQPLIDVQKMISESASRLPITERADSIKSNL
jgi:hypothetical protein